MAPRRRAVGKLADVETGEMHSLLERVHTPARYAFSGAAYGQFGLEIMAELTSKDSNLTGEDLRVLMYCAVRTYTSAKGGATTSELARHIGASPGAIRKITKRLSENGVFLVAEKISNAYVYKINPSIVFRGTGAEHREAVAESPRGVTVPIAGRRAKGAAS